MPHLKKIVLHCRNGYAQRINSLVEEFIQDGVIYVGIVGVDCARVEEIVDELVVGLGDRNYDLLTSSHPNKSVEDAVRFANSLTGTYEGASQIVEV